MRIVSGKFRGTNIMSPENNFVRPTTDKVREALFNILTPVIEGAAFLDLFGGAGGVGIEALSRGAESVTFVDSNRASYKLIQANLQKVRADATVLYADYLVALKRLAAEGARFDIIFIDPPYATNYAEKAVDFIAKNDLLREGGVVIVEHDGEHVPKVSAMTLTDTRKYGYCRLNFYKKEIANEEVCLPGDV